MRENIQNTENWRRVYILLNRVITGSDNGACIIGKEALYLNQWRRAIFGILRNKRQWNVVVCIISTTLCPGVNV